MSLLEVNNLEKHFDNNTGILSTLLGTKRGKIKAVDDVSFSVDENDSVGVIGESGCGKSTLLKTLIGIHDYDGGEIVYKGKEISDFDKSDWREYRKNVSMIFQDPYDTLNPKLTVEESLREPLIVNDVDNKRDKIITALERAELRPPERYLNRSPEQLSGGERQRVSIARAIILEPDILLADEPVSMLDISTQSSVLNLLLDLKDDLDMSIVYISHDLSTVSYLCDSINVMYLGRIIEKDTATGLVDNPSHPYTKALMNALPIANPHVDQPRTEIEGTPDTPTDLGEGCRFRDRCPERMDICEVTPREVNTEGEKRVACHLFYDHPLEENAAADEQEVINHG